MNAFLWPCTARNARKVHIERCEHALNFFADGAVADEQHGFPGKLFEHHRWIERPRIAGYSYIVWRRFKTALPAALTLDVVVEREVLEHGQNGADGPLGGAYVVSPACIADRNVRPHDRRNPFCAGHHGEDQAHAAQLWPRAQSSIRVRIRNPDVDLDFVVGTFRDADQLHSFRKITKELFG